MEIVLNIKAGSVMETMIVETVVTREIVMVQVQVCLDFKSDRGTLYFLLFWIFYVPIILSMHFCS